MIHHNNFIVNEIIVVYHFTMNENYWRSRWSRDQIRAILLEQFQGFWERDTGIPRDQLAQLMRAAPLPHAVIVDFYVPEQRMLIQVTQNLDQSGVREREVRALGDSLKALGLDHGLILTEVGAEPILEDGLTIGIRSSAQWLLAQ
jgi:hypothetical protein